jgi:transcriptional regulator with XRE-family HTH domain
MEKPRIGRIISNIRIKRGYSQEYIAFSLGISQKTFSRIEQDGDGLRIARLKKISDFLNVDPLRLISFYIDDKQNPADIETMSNIVDKSSNQYCNEHSCPFEKIIHHLEVEIEKLKNEMN